MRKLLLFTLLIFFASPIIRAQQDLFKAVFVYNFTKNIEWPTAYQTGDFIISVVGQDGLTAELKKLAATKKVNMQTIVVNQISNISDVPKSHIVYVSSSKSGQLASVIDYYKKSPTLIVSDQTGGCRDGSGINFVLVDAKLKFEICPKHVTAPGLLLSAKLTDLGIMVQ